MDLFTYLMNKNGNNVPGDLFSSLLGKGQSGTYQTFTGTSINANNTKKGKMKVNLLGNTSQETTIGKNLLPNDATSTTISGVTYTINSDKTIKVNGTATADSVLYLNSSSITIPAGTYTLNGCPSGGSWETYSMAFGNKNDSGSGNTFTLTESYSSQAYIRIASGYQANHLLFKPMLSTSGGDYEPYTNGARPNPDYPQVIHTITGDNIINVTGKNLFVKKLVIEDEKYLDNGNIATDSSYCRSPLYINCDGVTDLTISGSNRSSNGKIILYDENKNAIDYWSTRNRTITIPNNTKYLRISVEKAYKDTLQVEVGTTATSYSSDSQTYPIHLGEYELCKIGDYQDRFFKNIPNTTDYKSDLEDNEWYLRKAIGKVVLDGSENWATWYQTSNSNIGFYYTMSGLAKIGNESDYNNALKCNRFSEAQPRYEIYIGTTEAIKQCGGAGTQYIALGLAKTRLSDWSTNAKAVESLKAWLSSNNAITYYVLETPTYTQITGTLKDELEALQKAQSYKGTTNINQINNDLPFNMNVSVKVGN